MTAGFYYDNASFVDEEERKSLQKTKQQAKPQEQPEECGNSWIGSNGCGGTKPTLLSLSRSASVRYRPGGCVGGRKDAIGDFLARQIDQQRQSEPALSRNPSVRYSRRFPPMAGGGARCGYSSGSDDAAAAVAATAVAVAKATKTAVPPTGIITSVQVHAVDRHKEESQPIVQGSCRGDQ